MEKDKEYKTIYLNEAIRIILCFIHSFLYHGCATTIAYYNTYPIYYFGGIYAYEKNDDEIIQEIKCKIAELEKDEKFYKNLGEIFLKEINDITQEAAQNEKLNIVSDILDEFITKFRKIIEENSKTDCVFELDYNKSLAREYASLCNIDTSGGLCEMILRSRTTSDNNEEDEEEN